MIRNILLLLLSSVFFAVTAQERKVSLLFAGDAMQHMPQVRAAQTTDGYDYSDCFRLIEDRVRQADVAVINFETTLPGKRYSGYPMFGSPDAFAFALKDAGFNIFLTANNHSQDKGKHGVERTITVLDSMQVKHLGSYVNQDKRELVYPMMIIKNGIRIAMLNYTYGLNGLEVQPPNIINLIDKKQIYKDIQTAKQLNPDIIIAFMHWGYEYHLKQSKEQTDLARFLTENGVRLVIGSHPHVVQPVDIQRKNGSIENIVVYSLGNFISNQSQPNTDGGMMAAITLSKDGKGNVSIDNFDYSLIWVYKQSPDSSAGYQLIPVEDYGNGKAKLVDEHLESIRKFEGTARKTIESLW